MQAFQKTMDCLVQGHGAIRMIAMLMCDLIGMNIICNFTSGHNWILVKLHGTDVNVTS